MKKKSGLFIAIFSVMIFTSCEKEEEDTSSNIFLNDSLIENWDAERTTNINRADIKEKATTTFNEYGTANGLIDEINEGDKVSFVTANGLIDEINEGDKVSFGTANGLIDEINEGDEVSFETNSKKSNNNQLKSNGTVKFFNNSKGFGFISDSSGTNKPNNNQLKSNGTVKFFNNSKGFGFRADPSGKKKPDSNQSVSE